jgi:iron complex transport system substrate-binding protein
LNKTFYLKLLAFKTICILSLLLFSIACSTEPEVIIEEKIVEISKEVVKEVEVEVEKIVEKEVVVEVEKVIEVETEKVIVVTPTAEPAPTKIVVIDALGRELSFDSIPSNIATISPTATEMVYASGGKSTLRDRASTHPESVLSLPDVGSAYNPSVETIIGSRPDLVVIEAITQARFVEILGSVGLNVFAVKAESVDDVMTGIKNLGTIFGTEEIANKATMDIESRLAVAGTDDGRSVLILISDPDQNLYAALPSSYTGLIAEVIGMENKAAELSNSGPYPGFALMSPEAILMANPDVIITITPAPEPAPRLSSLITMIPPFAGLKAIQTGSIIEVDVDLFLQAPGPRIIEAVEFLKSALDSMK